MFLFSYLAASFAVLCFLLAAFILYHRRKSVLAPHLIALVLASGVWALSNAVADLSTTRAAGIFWSGTAVVSFLFLASFFLVLVARFIAPDKPLSRTRLLVSYLPAVALAPFAFSKWSTVDIIVLYDRPAQTVVGPFYIVGALFLYIAFAIAYYQLFRHRYASRERWLQAIYIVVGSFVMLVGLTVFDIVLPLFGELRLFSIGPLSTVCMIAALSYAIFRHRLLDIRPVIQRGLVYFILLALVVGVYLGTIFLLSLLFSGRTEGAYFTAAAVATLLGIFGVPPIERYFRRVTDRFFFKDRYDYSEALQELSEILAKNIERRTLLRRVAAVLQKHLRAYDVLFIPSGAPPQDTNEGGVTVPVMLENQAKGALVLGPKRSGDDYTATDLRLLRTFAYELAVALEKATLYQRLRKHSRELEKKVEERTAALQRIQEDQKQTMLDISHGLQTPLTVVKGELHFLKKQLGGNKKIAAFERSIDEISAFIYDLLHLARLEAEADPPRASVNASRLLHEVIEYCRLMAKDKQVLFTHRIEADVALPATKEKLAELVINLVNNAIKYAKPQGVQRIHIVLRRDGGSAVITVQDTGVGIPRRDLAHVFKRFYRVRDTATSARRGSGLGLAICKAIVERYGGTIAVQSAVGKGTKVTVRLPLTP